MLGISRSLNPSVEVSFVYMYIIALARMLIFSAVGVIVYSHIICDFVHRKFD